MDKTTPPTEEQQRHEVTNTLADITKASGTAVPVFVDHTTPAGYFGATAKVLGIVTSYLLEGEKGDPAAHIVGRSELHGIRVVSYLGDNLKGGHFIGVAGFEDIAELHAVQSAKAAR